MFWPFKLPHSHNFTPKSVRYPVIFRKPFFLESNPNIYSSPVSWNSVKGSAIYSECECGATQIELKDGKHEIWKNFAIKLFESEEKSERKI